MGNKPEAQQCIKNLCKVLDEYCKSQDCPERKTLDNVRAIYMVFFRDDGRARLHLVGSVSIAELTESTEVAIRQILSQFVEEGNPLAS